MLFGGSWGGFVGGRKFGDRRGAPFEFEASIVEASAVLDINCFRSRSSRGFAWDLARITGCDLAGGTAGFNASGEPLARCRVFPCPAAAVLCRRSCRGVGCLDACCWRPYGETAAGGSRSFDGMPALFPPTGVLRVFPPTGELRVGVVYVVGFL